MDAPTQPESKPQVWIGEFFIKKKQHYVYLHLQTTKDGHLETWDKDNKNQGNFKDDEERKIVVAEGFKYGSNLSLTWQFESDEYYDEEEGENYEWGFNGYVNYTDDIATSVTGYFYYFETDDKRKVSVRYEGKFTIKELD